jgi:hypothetical protein
MSSEKRQRINWFWFGSCELAGGLLIALALYMEKYHEWKGVSTSSFVDVGSAFLLAGVLFFVERRFLRNVGVVAKAVAQAEVKEQTEDLRVRLDELSDLVKVQNRQDDDRRAEKVREMDVPTFKSVADLLGDANNLKTLGAGRVVVPGTTDVNGLSLSFSWGESFNQSRFNHEPGEELVIGIVGSSEFQGRTVFNEVGCIEWESNESALEVWNRIRELLQSLGLWRGDETLDWSLALTNLQKALDWASRSRRHTGDPDQLQGAPIEMVNDEWVITDQGAECPSRGFVMSASDFPQRVSFRFNKNDGAEEWLPPAPPEGLDPTLWHVIIERGRGWFPRPPAIFKTFPDWLSLDHGPSD